MDVKLEKRGDEFYMVLVRYDFTAKKLLRVGVDDIRLPGDWKKALIEEINRRVAK